MREGVLPGHAVVPPALGRGAAPPVGQEAQLRRPLRLPVGPLGPAAAQQVALWVKCTRHSAVPPKKMFVFFFFLKFWGEKGILNSILDTDMKYCAKCHPSTVHLKNLLYIILHTASVFES